MRKLAIYKNVALRPWEATKMLCNHRRTLKYLWTRNREAFWNHVFVTYFVRGEDCGKGILDPIWKLTGTAPFLWDIEMETTTACYLKCIHCEHTYWEDKTYLNRHLSLDTLRSVIGTTSNLHWINLTGEGTSVLNPAFFEMIHCIKEKGIYLDFSHDFVKLSDVQAEDLVRWGVDRVYWSIDGCTKETYEKIRVGANFDDVIANVKKLLAAKKRLSSPLPEICFRYAFFKDNVEEVPLLPSLLRSIVSDVKDYGDEPSINVVSLLEFEQTRDWAIEISQEAYDRTNASAKDYGFKMYWSHKTHIEEEKAPMDYCTFWSEPYVMITGHVVPCCAVLMSNNRKNLESMSFGSVKDKPLSVIWNSLYYREFRRLVVDPKAPVPSVCVGCRAFNTKTRLEKYGTW